MWNAYHQSLGCGSCRILHCDPEGLHPVSPFVHSIYALPEPHSTRNLAHLFKGDVQLSFALPESLGARVEVAPADRTGASLGALRLPVRAVGLSMAFVGGSGSRSGSSSGSLPVWPVSGCCPRVYWHGRTEQVEQVLRKSSAFHSSRQLRSSMESQWLAGSIGLLRRAGHTLEAIDILRIKAPFALVLLDAQSAERKVGLSGPCKVRVAARIKWWSTGCG
jgi:hypothetical protein